MHLNGWQRLWVLVTAVWLILMAVVAWNVWPDRPGQYLSIFPTAGINLQTGEMAEIDYYTAVAMIIRAKSEPAGWRPVLAEPLFVANPDDVVVSVPTIGRVHFPGSMSRSQIEAAADTLTRDADAVTRNMSDGLMQQFFVRRREVLRRAIACAIIPPLALYGIGLAFTWVYRGFRPVSKDRRPVDRHDTSA